MTSKLSKHQRSTCPKINGASVERFLHLLASSSPYTEFKVTSEVIKRVSKGTLGELLAFLGERMIGRRDVREARKRINGATTGGENVTLHPGLVELEKAKRRMRAARAAVEVARKERVDVRTRLERILEEKNDLEQKVSKQRELISLLEELEVRETIRLNRIREVTRLTHALRNKVEDAKATGKLGVPLYNTTDANLKSPQWRPRYTREMVAKLHAYHIRLGSGKFARTQEMKIKEAEDRLKNVLTEKLGRDVTDEELREILTKCRGAAEETRRGYIKLSHSDSSVVEQSADEVRIKEAKITELNEDIIVKLFLVERHLQTVQAFHENKDAIRQELSEIDKEARGFVRLLKDDLVRSYVTRTSRVKEESSSGNDISGLNSEHFKRQLERCRAMETVVRKLSALKKSECNAEITASYERARQELEERVGKTLEHKIAKAKTGLEIAKDIEVLIGEARKLTSAAERRVA